MSVGTDLAYCTLTGSQLAWCRMAMKGKSVKQLIANVQEDLRDVLAIKSKEQSKEPLRQRDLTECCRVGNVQGETLLVTLVPYRIDFREIRLPGFRVPGYYSEPDRIGVRRFCLKRLRYLLRSQAQENGGRKLISYGVKSLRGAKV